MKKLRKILIVSHYYPPHVGGIEIVAYNQAKRLAGEGHDVTVVTSSIGSKEKDTVVENVRVVRVGACNYFERFGIPFPILSPRIWFVLWKFSKEADIVHIHDVFYITSFVAAVSARLRGKTIVLTQHVAMIAHPNPLVVALERLVYATTGRIIFWFSNTVIYYNERVKEFIISNGVSPHKFLVLKNGVDRNLFHPVSLAEKKVLRAKHGLNQQKNVLLFVGRFVPKKGFDKILSIQNPEYTIVCAGGKKPEGVFPHAVFMGETDQKTLAELYQLADVFILPSECEGFPLAIQEAMSSGLPIITTRDNGYREYYFDENRICFIDARDEYTLRTEVEKIFNNRDLLRSMSQYSEEYAEKYFSWSFAVSQLEIIYDSALQIRLALVTDAAYPFNKGGKEKRIFDLSTLLQKNGFKVTIYCMKWWKGGNTIVKDNVLFTAISPYYPLYAGNRRSLSEAIFFSLHCLKLIFKDFDVIDVDHIPHLTIFTAKIVCFLKRKPMVATWHEVWGEKYWRTYLAPVTGFIAYTLEKMSMRLPDVIISVSPHTTERLKAVLEKYKNEIITIPNGIDVDCIQNSPKLNFTSDIIFAGRLLSHKNVDVLLRAVSLIQKIMPDVRACIVGNGPEKENLQALVKELGIEKNVSFLGFFDDQRELYGTMKASKVFVLPSTREGFGITVIEAYACGLPVITIDHPHNAAKDLIYESSDGLSTGIVVPLQPSALADAMMRCIKDFGDRKDKEIYTSKALQYNWNNVVQDVIHVYKKTYE